MRSRNKRKLVVCFLTLTGIFILLYYRRELQRKAIREAINRRQTIFQTKPSCRNPAAETPHFVEVEKGTLFYSAWFDDRQDPKFVRILLMTWRRDNPPPLSCRFYSGSNSNTSANIASTYYEINKGHKLHYGLFVVSCVLSDKLITTPPGFVEISIKLSPEKPSDIVVLSVGNTCIKRQRGSTNTSTWRREYGICIAPLFGKISVISLIEFLELSQVIGASYFTFYDFQTSDNIQKVLSYYVDKGLAEVLPWKLPPYIFQEDVHYHGQILAMQECLFRRMNDLKFLAFNDLDEFIVPLQYENMTSLLHSIHREEHCGHCFKSARFPHSRSDAESSWPAVLTQNIFNRKRKEDKTHNKCVVDPQSVFEQGVHLIMNPLEDFYVVDNVEWDVGRSFHYRECPQPCNAGELEVDKTMERYGKKLQQRIENIIGIIGLKGQSREGY